MVHSTLGIVLITGLSILDGLINPASKSWIIEFYGERKIVDLIMYRLIAFRSSFGKVFVIINTDFGGFDPYMVSLFIRMFKGDPDNILISRTFRQEDLVGLLNELNLVKVLDEKILVLKYPYRFIPFDPRKYGEASRITGLLKRLVNNGWPVFLFNTVSRFGKTMPEGGTFHHHAVHVIVELKNIGKKLYKAVLRKHPFRPTGLSVLISTKQLYGRDTVIWVGQRRLSEWLSIKS